MTADVTESQCKISRNLALVIKAVLQSAPELEIRIEVINIAANELAIGVGHRGSWIRGQEGHGLSAIWRCERVRGITSRVVSFQPRNDIAGQERRVIKSDAATNNALVIERICQPDAGPKVTVVRFHQAAVAGLQTSLAGGSHKGAQARPCNERIGVGNSGVKSTHVVMRLGARIRNLVSDPEIER